MEFKDITDEKKNENRMLVERLVDKENPEMITFVRDVEVDDISVLQSVAIVLNKERKSLGLDNTFLNIFIQSNLVIRTSMQGKRSEQIVNTIQGVIQQEQNIQAGIGGLGRRIFGGG